MAQLKPASFLAQISSLIFPKQLAAELRTEKLDNGQIQVTPVFMINGHEVPSELVGANKKQTILGYSVVLGGPADVVVEQTQGKPTTLTKKRAAAFLRLLSQSGVAVRNRDGKVEPRIQYVKPDVTLNLLPNDSLAVESELVSPNGVVVEKPDSLDDVKQDDGWFSSGDNLMRVSLTGTAIDDVLIGKGGDRTLTGDDVPRFIKDLQDHPKNVGAVEQDETLRNLSVFSGKPENRVKVDGDKDHIHVQTLLVYKGSQDRQYEQLPEVLDQFAEKGGGFRRVSEGWVEITPESISHFRIANKELTTRLGDVSDVRGTDIPKVLSQLSEAPRRFSSWKNPWSVYFSQAVEDAHRLIETSADVQFKLNLVESDGMSLLALDPVYNHERFQLTHGEAQTAIRAGEQWIRRRDAWIKIDSDKSKKIEASIERFQMQPGPSGFTFPASQREQVIQVFSLLGSIQQSEAYAEFLAKLADFEKIEPAPLPASLRPEIQLRSYQQHGYNWLAFLHRFGLNGILADDMGLGKTLQTLAVVERAKEKSASTFPTLIICPTSVVNNWKSEIQKFFHDATVVVYTGGSRAAKLKRLANSISLFDQGFAAPYVVTSYDIARRDHDLLNKLPWLYVVVDEGHNIKNPSAERSKAIKTIPGQHKLALTGTPIQNNLEELWSLFDFAMPGYLGTRSSFKQIYGRAGSINWSAVNNGSTNLKDRIHPFVMRRLKEHVAKDLPPVSVVEQKVELTALQVDLYRQVKQSAEYRRMIEAIEQKGMGRSQTDILAALTKLKNICNHPVLAQTGPLKYEDSGKLECLKELIEEIIEGEHRVLLFSQSTRMLNIIESFFKQWKVTMLRLDGSTPANSRQQLVDEFNTNQSIHCFLISTKAGGTGLNITAADTVIFYDHDWNPANDNQAQARAHRIGQVKPVTVYKLISRGTIEEKILERQAIKQSLADAIIGVDGEGFKNISREELLSLFTLDEEADE